MDGPICLYSFSTDATCLYPEAGQECLNWVITVPTNIKVMATVHPTSIYLRVTLPFTKFKVKEPLLPSSTNVWETLPSPKFKVRGILPFSI